MIEVFLEQLKKSKLFVILILASSLVRMESFLYILTLILGVAAITAIHELLHVKRAEEMGYEVKVDVKSLGNVNYVLKAPKEVLREVARAPYFRPHQYMVELFFLLLLTLEALLAGFPFFYLLMAFNLFIYLHFLSVICTWVTFKGRYCPLAKLVSKDDLREGLL